MASDEKEEGEWQAGRASSAGATHGFAREQLVACDECLRPNAPTRMNCLYCGAALPVDESGAALRRPTIRPLEEWERGFSAVLLPTAPAARGGNFEEALGPRAGRAGDRTRFEEESLAEAASLLRLEVETLREMVAAGSAVPLARVATRAEASLIRERLGALGFALTVLADEELCGEKAQPLRVRRLEFGGETLEGWAGVASEPRAVAWGEVVLLVRGQMLTERVEVEERSVRLGADRAVADERRMFGDANVLDLFAETREGVAHWRIASDAFDYSCLGEHKTLLAKDNFETLVRTLRASAPRAVYDDAYKSVRRLLAAAWPPIERAAAGGLRRERPGKFNVEVVASTSNETQFTRYARMLFWLRAGRTGGPQA